MITKSTSIREYLFRKPLIFILIIFGFAYFIFPIIIYGLSGNLSKLSEFINIQGTWFVIFYLGTIFLFIWKVATLPFSPAFRGWRRKRLMENVPTSKIRSMAMGIVELHGSAVTGLGVLKAPLTNRECIYYKIEVAGFSSSQSDSLFYLEDDTGKVLIDPKKVEILLDNSSKYQFIKWHNIKKIPDSILNYCATEGISGDACLNEWIIRPNDQIYVLGTVYKDPSLIIDYKSKLEKQLKSIEFYPKKMEKKFNEELLRIKNNPRDMKRLDTDGDGVISNEEWDQAVSDLKQNLVESQRQQMKNMQETDLVVGKGEGNSLYIISSESEKALCNVHSKNMRREFTALLLILFFYLIFCLYEKIYLGIGPFSVFIDKLSRK